jgi:hypothetical protein
MRIFASYPVLMWNNMVNIRGKNRGQGEKEKEMSD